MSIGININCYSRDLPLEKQIELMKENGFETTFCMDGEAVEGIIETVSAVFNINSTDISVEKMKFERTE